MNSLLIEEYPLVILPQLAKVIGLNEAIILQQIHYWIDLFKKANDQKHFQDGEWWVWNTGTEWNENFPFWSECTVRRVLDNLRKPYTPKNEKDPKIARKALVIVGRYNKKGYDQTLWYRIDYAEIERLESILSNCENGHRQDDNVDLGKVHKPIPETTTETTTELGANAPDLSIPLKIIHYPEDEEFRCPNPFCDESVNWAVLKKNRAVCPICGQYLEGYELGDTRPTWKPPKVRAKKKTLSDIIPDCPEKLADIMYYARDKKTLELLLETNKGLLLDCLNWAVGKMAKGEMAPNVVVARAIAWMQKRLKAEPQQEPKKQLTEKEKRMVEVARLVNEEGLSPEEARRKVYNV